MSKHDINETTAVVKSNSDWRPIDKANGELNRVLKSNKTLSENARQDLKKSAFEILSKCGDPKKLGNKTRTGLVVGYVQSGKTLSFTTVAAGAVDQGYKTIAVLGGSSVPLSQQNADRLEEDLEVLSGFNSKWHHVHNPTADNIQDLQDTLESKLTDRALLLTAMKHQTHTSGLSELLEGLGSLAEPVLIIDDEADNVSLNSKASRDEVSTNYDEICKLRQKNPRHVYLQYTATPQANVLISVLSHLKPDFGHVLEPGKGYLGGNEVFVDSPNDFLEEIPVDEAQRAEDEDVPPDSYFKAISVFLFGAAQWWHIRKNKQEAPPTENLSMMIHPHRLRAKHGKYKQWLEGFLERISCELPDDCEPGRPALIEMLKEVHGKLEKTITDFGSFDKLIELIPDAIKLIKVQEFSGKEKPDKGWKKSWKESPHQILIGGQLLDRGFTVEGLTVTYMPRSTGTGQADTIQQRARFFGYKQAYRGFCRIFLTSETMRLYRSYVTHEQSLREFIQKNCDRLGKRDTIRHFRLDRSLRPTRDSILTKNDRYKRLKNSPWFYQTWVDGRRNQASVFDDNRSVIDDFCKSREFESDRNHRKYKIKLKNLFDNLLNSLVLSNKDAETWENILISLSDVIERFRDADAFLYVMRADEGRSNKRALKKDSNGTLTEQIKEVPAGRSSDHEYPGDREMKDGLLTLQVHNFVVGDAPNEPEIPILGLWLHTDLRDDIVVQNQNRSQDRT